jgi:hypothetical protein
MNERWYTLKTGKGLEVEVDKSQAQVSLKFQVEDVIEIYPEINGIETKLFEAGWAQDEVRSVVNAIENSMMKIELIKLIGKYLV